jgi:hypothetical protein
MCHKVIRALMLDGQIKYCKHKLNCDGRGDNNNDKKVQKFNNHTESVN